MKGLPGHLGCGDGNGDGEIGVRKWRDYCVEDDDHHDVDGDESEDNEGGGGGERNPDMEEGLVEWYVNSRCFYPFLAVFCSRDMRLASDLLPMLLTYHIGE